MGGVVRGRYIGRGWRDRRERVKQQLTAHKDVVLSKLKVLPDSRVYMGILKFLGFLGLVHGGLGKYDIKSKMVGLGKI